MGYPCGVDLPGRARCGGWADGDVVERGYLPASILFGEDHLQFGVKGAVGERCEPGGQSVRFAQNGVHVGDGHTRPNEAKLAYRKFVVAAFVDGTENALVLLEERGVAVALHADDIGEAAVRGEVGAEAFCVAPVPSFLLFANDGLDGAGVVLWLLAVCDGKGDCERKQGNA